MRKVKRWRYYCDFCKKVGGSAGHMKTHELHCTGNPDRICRMCKLADLVQKPTTITKKIVKEYMAKEDKLDMWSDFDKRDALTNIMLDRLEEVTGGCPACIHSALKQSGADLFIFDFQTEFKAFYKDNISQDDDCPY